MCVALGPFTRTQRSKVGVFRVFRECGKPQVRWWLRIPGLALRVPRNDEAVVARFPSPLL